MKKLTKIITLIISIVFIFAIIFLFFKPICVLALLILLADPLTYILSTLSMIIILAFLIDIFYNYLLCIIKKIKSRKKIVPIFMILFIILILVILAILNSVAKTFFAQIFLPLIYIFIVITIPLIIIGINLLNKNRSKKIKIIFTIILIILTISIYIINYSYLKKSANSIIENIGEFLETKDYSSTYNLKYLENYQQKMDRDGYIEKDDVKNILNIADNRADTIIVIYNDSDEQIELNNTDNDLQEELEPKLEGNYYKFSYEHKDGQTKIYIEKYESEVRGNYEINEDIIIDGFPNYSIENISKYYETDEDENFLFENEITVTPNDDTELDNLRILFVYEEESDNYIPYVENQGELRKIKSYKIYSTGISITLKDEMTLEKKDYTIRINRYDEENNVKEEKDINYCYIYEPVVTETTDSNGNVVIQLDFDETYKLKDLKNIEIIF